MLSTVARLHVPACPQTPDLLVGFKTDRLRRTQAMKTAGRKTKNRRDRLSNEPSSWGGRPKPFLLNQGGWRSRKHPAAGEVFFLTSPFIELLSSAGSSGVEFQAGVDDEALRVQLDHRVDTSAAGHFGC